MRRLFWIVVVLALAAGACGDDGDAAETTTTEPIAATTTTAAPTTAPPTTTEPEPEAIDLLPPYVWAAAGGSVSQIDPVTEEIVAQIELGGDPDVIIHAPGGLWVSDCVDNRIFVVDPGAAEVTEDEGKKDAVNLMTVHAAKGLEFKNVFVINVCRGRFPSRKISEKIPFPEKLMKERLPSGDPTAP